MLGTKQRLSYVSTCHLKAVTNLNILSYVCECVSMEWSDVLCGVFIVC